MSIKNSFLLLGAHVSISDSIDKAIERGESLGCTTIQIFVKNNRQWSSPRISSESSEQFKIKKERSDIKVVVAHGTYLINLCSDNPDVINKSIKSLEEELLACDLLDIPYLVLHPGSSTNNNAINTIAQNINMLYEKNNFRVHILLETMAGQGSTIGKNFNELKEILDHLNSEVKKRVGVCFDTCHVFAAGYDLNSYENIINQFDKIIGLEKLKIFHINDSKRELGSCVDRHEDIGKGKIGLTFFKKLMNDLRFQSIPKIIETPKETVEEDLINLNVLKNLVV